MAEVLLPHGLLLDVVDRPIGVNSQASMYRSREEANYDLRRELDRVTLPLFDGTSPTVSPFPSYRTAISLREFNEAGFDNTEQLRELMRLMLTGRNQESASEVPFTLRLGGSAGELANPRIANTSLGFSLADDVFRFFPTLTKDPEASHPDPFFFGWGRGIVGQEPLIHGSDRRIGFPFNFNQINQEAEIVRSTINLLGIKVQQGNLEPV